MIMIIIVLVTIVTVARDARASLADRLDALRPPGLSDRAAGLAAFPVRAIIIDDHYYR